MDKYNRFYLLTIETNDGEILNIERPFTVEFDIHRNTLSSANVGSFRIYNLTPNHRAQIRHDQFDFNDIRTVTFFAGYSSITNANMAFTGFISQAWSVREGNNFITQIESYDGGLAFVNATTGTQFPKGTPKSEIISALAATLPNIKLGAISKALDSDLARGNTFSGSTTKILHDLTGGGFFIDNGQANFLADNEYLNFGTIPLINSQSGLLGTPIRENTYINTDLLFEPSIHAGGLVTLESNASDGGFNGTHKVVSLKHRGMISDAVCGDAVTSLGLLPGKFDALTVTQTRF